MLALLARVDPSGTLGGSALASWRPLVGLLVGFGIALVALYAFGRANAPRWPLLQPLSRIPNGIQRLTGVPGWAGASIGLALFGLLVAGQGFYSDVAWHIALGRDKNLFTAPHTSILLGLIMILGGAVVGTLVATFEGIDGLHLGGLRVPRSLVPLWALGLGAVSGFPLDEVWHREYGIDVTMWSPTHMLMILGATFTGLAAWLILAESGVRPGDGRWARGLHLVCGWLTLQGLLAPQGEFTFGVPQFNLLFSPILVCLAAGMGLVAIRIVHGRGWMLGLVVVNFLIQTTGFLNLGGDGGGPIDTRFGATFLASAVMVELIAWLAGTEDRLRFALLSGLGIGTVGLAGEYAWNTHAWQPWTTNLFPAALLLGVVASIGAAVLGVAFARAVQRDGSGAALPRFATTLAGLACLAVILLPMRRPTGDVSVAVHLERHGADAAVVATVTPADAADHASWFQATAWQGGGLELADMEATGRPGEFRSDGTVPVGGQWKTLLRLHRGSEMMAVPLFLPADAGIDAAEVPAVDRTMRFRSEREYLLRETHSGNGWLSPVIHLALLAVCATWALAFSSAVRALAPGGGRPRPPRSERRSAAAAAA